MPRVDALSRGWSRIRGRLFSVCCIVLLAALVFVLNSWDITSVFLVRQRAPQLKQDDWPIFDELLTPLLLRLKAHRDPASPQVSTVAFGAGELQYIQDDPCRGRRFMADVVDVLNRLNTNVIVIDKYYRESSCSKPEDNERFRKALATSAARVVVGIHTDASFDANGRWTLTVAPSLQFPTTREASDLNDLVTGHPVVEGVLRFNPDLFRIPLEWPVVDESHHGERYVETIAFAAARLSDPQIVHRQGLAKFLDTGFSPYGESANLLLHDMDAAEVLCGDPVQSSAAALRKEWNLKCDASPSQKITPIVVIGSPAEKDSYPLDGRSVYGYQIFAMYIEELLSARYLGEIPFSVWYTALLIWVVLTQAWLICTDSPWKVLAMISAATVVIVASFMIALILWDLFPPTKFLLSLLFSLLVAALLELGEKLRERKKPEKSSHRVHRRSMAR